MSVSIWGKLYENEYATENKGLSKNRPLFWVSRSDYIWAYALKVAHNT